MKKVLVVTYSQSGQLDDIVLNIISGLPDNVEIHHEKLIPIPSYNFPWKGISFYDVMPESVKLIPGKIEPLSVDENQQFDLIIIGYPIWFLSPPIPITTFLVSEKAKKLMNGKPVITVIGARNMWVGAQEDIKKMIIANGAKLVGNIALHDRNNNLASVITIVYWMSTGKKDKYLGIFPTPGISDNDIADASRFAKPIAKALLANNFGGLQDSLLNLKAIELSPNVVSTERKGKKMFNIWANFILKKGGPRSKFRVTRLKMFSWYLMFVIFAVSPFVSLIFYLTWPLHFLKTKNKMRYYSGVELKK